MALIETGPGYTQTGNNFLTSLGNKLSFIPFVGGGIAMVLGWAGTILESAGWLLRGKPISAVTSLAAGGVSASVQGLRSVPGLGQLIYWGNLGSGVATGRSIGTHARKLTESVIGGATGALGQRPTVLRSYPAGIGSIGAPNRPGQFARMEAERRGQNPQGMYDAYMRGEGGVHVNELGSASGRGA